LAVLRFEDRVFPKRRDTCSRRYRPAKNISITGMRAKAQVNIVRFCILVVQHKAVCGFPDYIYRI
jgi:hypothetical protein